MKRIFLVLGALACFTATPVRAQLTAAGAPLPVQPFLFNVSTLTAENTRWNVMYSGSFAERAFNAAGYTGFNQQLNVAGYLGSRFTLLGSAAIGFAPGGRVQSIQQAEVLRDLVGGKTFEGFRLGVGAGASKNWENHAAVFGRLTANYILPAWRLGANARVEKAFQKQADKADVTFSLGAQTRLGNGFFGGVETIAEDVEGFWEKDEAEGGAKMMVGPSLHYAPENSKVAFSLAGGPIFYATHSKLIDNGQIRDLLPNARSGYIIRAMVAYSIR